VLLSLGYGCGLRAGEVVRLKVKDIDRAQNIIRVEQSKGRKDRHVMLSPEMLALLRQWWRVLERLALDAGHDTGNQPTRQAQLDNGNQRRIHVERGQGSTKVIRLALLWHGGSIAGFTFAPMDTISSPLAP
jgi:integrase